MKAKLKLLSLMARTGLTMADGVNLYGKYVGNWGGTAPQYRFEAWKNGQKVASITKAPPCRASITAQASSLTLTEGDTYDAALVRITATDENGSRLPYFNEPVVLSAEGAVQLIGPEVTALRGGAGGTLVRTTGVTGEGRLKISVPGHNEVTVTFEVK